VASHEGSFENDRGTFDYEIVTWRTETGRWREDSLTENKLSEMDIMIAVVENTETGHKEYQTINGPLEDWGEVEDLLEYDWSGEGSR